MRLYFPAIIIALVTAVSISVPLYAEEQIDASDPTKIYTYVGAGVKYTDYTNDESMLEVRATGNIGLSPSDMVMFELGYGWHDGDLAEGSDNGITNGRLRWFHLFPMDYSVTSGYRGWGTQVDVQMAGKLKGTDGQNTIALGVLPAFGISEKWSFYLASNLVNSWDKDFDKYNGIGVSLAPLLVYSPDWWSGSYIQFWPAYTYFVGGELQNEGSGNIDVITGGAITDTVMWSLTFQQNFDVDLNTYRRGRETGLKNDWNLFFSMTTYL